MNLLQTGEPVWDLSFDERGRLTAPDEDGFLGEVVDRQVTDLFVFSHGWGTSEDSARGLYREMFPLIRQAAVDLGLVQVGFVGVYWPSLWFPPTPATPPPAVGSTQAGDGAVVDLSAGTGQVSGAEIADALSPGFADPAQREAIRQIGKLIDDGLAAADAGEPEAAQQQRVEQLHELISQLVPPAPDGEVEDSGETALLLAADPKTAFDGAADAFGSAPAGSSTQNLGDRFKKAFHGAKDAVRVLSYTVMKARAGDIGRNGLGPLLARLRTRSGTVRVHLIGHSFGARLVSFALAGLDDQADSPVASLVLLQGAFSHWAFAHAQDNPFGEPGALNAFPDRVHGPMVATFSSYDWAVGVWYPKASFLARQDAEAETTGRWMGLGADGFQAVNPLAELTMPAEGSVDYGMVPRTFYRVDAAAVINDVSGDRFSGAHSDIRKAQVAQLVAAAAAAK
jgi:hypothetical protein